MPGSKMGCLEKTVLHSGDSVFFCLTPVESVRPDKTDSIFAMK